MKAPHMIRTKVVFLGVLVLIIIVMVARYINPDDANEHTPEKTDVTLQLNMADTTSDCTIEKAVSIYLKGEGVELAIGDTITLNILYFRKE